MGFPARLLPHIFFHPDYTVACGFSPHQALQALRRLYCRSEISPCPEDLIISFCLELVGRVAGEVGDDAVSILQIEHLKDGVGGLAVLTLHDGVPDAH